MSDGRFEVYQDTAGKFRFRLRAPNNRIVAVGEAYDTKASCLKGVDAVKRYASASIIDLTSARPHDEAPSDITTEIAARAKTLGVASTTIHLEDPTPDIPRVKKNTLIHFTGQLVSGRERLTDVRVSIREHDRSFMSDEVLASGTTDSEGRFRIPWRARQTDWWDDSVEVYAQYNGSDTYLPAKSRIYTFTVY